MMVSYRHHWKRALDAAPERLHFAAHSHHLWPDVSFDGHMQAWNDAARFADRKWEKIFTEILPRAQAHVARTLGLRSSNSIAFATNTHELYVRLLSCLPADGTSRPVRILSTDSEFHSFSRQTARLAEDGLVTVHEVATRPLETFVSRFAQAAREGSYDLVFFSHVFFNSGFCAAELETIVSAVTARDTFIVVDGYHAFMALPFDVKALQDRIFYLGGGYKYAMSGEGCAFLHAPEGFAERPRNTGWFASFGTLEAEQNVGRAVPYAPHGARMLGATFDPSGLYRFVAVMDLLATIGVPQIHAHVHALQRTFVDALDARPGLPVRSADLVVAMSESRRGHFLTFDTVDALRIHERLLEDNVVTDVRGSRLRFGFGLYHDESDVMQLVDRMQRTLR
jgi:selenocysteine lyase/cysteine desulfurase